MDTPNPASSDLSPVPSQPEKVSVWEDFMDIFYAPGDVFRRRENGNFWIPLLVVTVLMAVLAMADRNVMRLVFDAEFARNSATLLKSNPQLTGAMLDRARKTGFLVAQYGTVVIVPIMILVFAFVAWLLAKLFGAKVSWNASLVIASFAMVPKVVQQIVLAIQGLLMDPANITSRFSIEIGPGRFFNPGTGTPLLGALYDHVELFALWTVVLIAIGAAVVGKLPKAKAWAFGLAFWIVTMLPALYQAWKIS